MSKLCAGRLGAVVYLPTRLRPVELPYEQLFGSTPEVRKVWYFRWFESGRTGVQSSPYGLRILNSKKVTLCMSVRLRWTSYGRLDAPLVPACLLCHLPATILSR